MAEGGGTITTLIDRFADLPGIGRKSAERLAHHVLGMSRDDAGTFLPRYQEEEIVRQNPFAVLDQGGVGKLMETAVKLGRATRKDIKLGICGEHGGEPDSVKFCHRLGLAYVSCSPFRLPIARLAAAQAALKS